MKSIVIVEDDYLLASMYQAKFEHAGYRVDVFGAAEPAAEEITKHPPDLLVLDVLLPEKNGLWLLKELHARQVRVPIIMLTNLAEADFAMPQKLRARLGIVAYCVKTQVTPAEVLLTVQEALA